MTLREQQGPAHWGDTSTRKSYNSECSSSPSQGRPGWVWAPQAWQPGWEGEDPGCGGHSAMGLLLQPLLAGWLAGSTMFGKTVSRSQGHLPRDTEARKRGSLQPPDLWACLQVRSPAWEAGPMRLSAVWPEALGRPRLPGSVLCHLLSCLSGD